MLSVPSAGPQRNASAIPGHPRAHSTQEAGASFEFCLIACILLVHASDAGIESSVLFVPYAPGRTAKGRNLGFWRTRLLIRFDILTRVLQTSPVG